MSQKGLVYGLVATGTTILAAYKSCYEDVIITVAAQYLQELPASCTHITYLFNEHTYNFLVDGRFVYLVVADESTLWKVSFACLERVKDEFKKLYAKDGICFDSSFDWEFRPKIKEHMENCLNHPDVETEKAKMQDLSKIAMGYYQAGTDEVRELARNFFRAMDTDGDNKIDQREFLEFMKEQRQMNNLVIFKQLDLDGNGTLDFKEMMTLYYVIKSERPFCVHCKGLIVSVYFTCVGCLEDKNGELLHLCMDCYASNRHTHNGLSLFMDNYSLLTILANKFKNGQLLRLSGAVTHNEGCQCAQEVHVNHTTIHNHIYSCNNVNHTPPDQPTGEIQNSQGRNSWKIALQALNIGLQIGAVAAGCSIQ